MGERRFNMNHRHKALRRRYGRAAYGDKRDKPKFHRDGSVTYWSVYDQAWRRSWSVPDRELAAMPEAERRKIQKRVRAPADNGSST
jgi:ribosomal protein L32E